MVKQTFRLFGFLCVTTALTVGLATGSGSLSKAYAQIPITTGAISDLTGIGKTRPLIAKYQPTDNSTGCSHTGSPQSESEMLATQSVEMNLSNFQSNVVSRIMDWGNSTTKAISVSSQIEEMILKKFGVEDTKTKEAIATVEQNQRVEMNTLEAMKSAAPTEIDKDFSVGMSYYNPELVSGFRQHEMQRYISELNMVPLANEKRDAGGRPKDGYVDTSRGEIAAMGQEFRNYIRIFCDVRSVNGRLASTKFVEIQVPAKAVEYWCGQARGLAAPPVAMGADGRYKPLESAALSNYIKQQVTKEEKDAEAGKGKIKLINASKNPGDLYFETHSLTTDDQDVYEFAEQEFARMVIGRAPNMTKLPDLSRAEGQRDFMNVQARTAKLALARYPFADMFARKVPSLSKNSSTWAASLIEQNLGNCAKADESYQALCDLTKQLRSKGQISEAEFFDVLFNRQFQGEAFTNKVIGMTSGQLKRTQATLMGLQLALNYQRNRLKEQQLALMAAIYAQQVQK